MKLVVPLTMPSIRCTPLTISDSRSTFTTGIAAQTLASNRSCTPRRSASAKSSSPCRASSCLLADTTDLPAAISSSTWVRVGSIPPITSATTVIAGSSRRRAKSVVSRPAGRRGVPRGVAHERGGDDDRPAGHPLDRLGALAEQRVDGRADRAETEQPDADLAHPGDDSGTVPTAGTGPVQAVRFRL